MNLMKKVVREKNQTLVMVTHDNYLAGFADLILRIKDGRIIEIEDRRGMDMPDEIQAKE
jgi:putative ABC transport system ATP-binding protein